MRVRTITSDEALKGPDHITGLLKEAGFRFDRERCPVKIRPMFSIEHHPDGSTTFRQWGCEHQ